MVRRGFALRARVHACLYKRPASKCVLSADATTGQLLVHSNNQRFIRAHFARLPARMLVGSWHTLVHLSLRICQMPRDDAIVYKYESAMRTRHT